MGRSWQGEGVAQIFQVWKDLCKKTSYEKPHNWGKGKMRHNEIQMRGQVTMDLMYYTKTSAIILQETKNYGRMSKRSILSLLAF